MSGAERLIIHVRNTRGYKPADAQHIREYIKREAPNTIGVNVRVSTKRIEVDATTPNPRELIEALRKLGAIIDRGPKNLLELLGEERYWEAHELLEEEWRNTEPPARDRIKALIKTVAAMAKLQEGWPDKARRILSTIKANGIDIECVEGELEKAWQGVRSDIIPCIDIGYILGVEGGQEATHAPRHKGPGGSGGDRGWKDNSEED